jgi:tryptophan synthase beta chain
MEHLGARVVPVYSGSRTLKDAVSETIRDWVANVRNTFYVLGSCVGPHPYPMMVRDFHRVIGREAKRQILAQAGRLPDYMIACVGGGSNAIGIFYEFLGEKKIKLMGVEAGGYGLKTGMHGATLSAGSPGVLHGALSYLLQTRDGQVMPTHSVSAGLDYPGVGPEHSLLKDLSKVTYDHVTDKQALRAFSLLSTLEGIIPALESAHALAYLLKIRNKLKRGAVVIINLSGRGDKDIQTIVEKKW